jgi:hypothetical protein
MYPWDNRIDRSFTFIEEGKYDSVYFRMPSLNPEVGGIRFDYEYRDISLFISSYDLSMFYKELGFDYGELLSTPLEAYFVTKDSVDYLYVVNLPPANYKKPKGKGYEFYFKSNLPYSFSELYDLLQFQNPKENWVWRIDHYKINRDFEVTLSFEFGDIEIPFSMSHLIDFNN